MNEIPPSDLLGTHCLLDLFGCEPDLLDQPAALETALRRAAEGAGATVVGALQHRFSPHGVSVVCLLAESHISIHTWPEQRMAAADIYTCGPSCDPAAACDALARALGAQSVSLRTLPRGQR